MEFLKKRSFPLFIFSIILCCLVYFLVEIFLNHRLALLVDEFWFAHSAFRYGYELPYRDFPPYKTILGYYLLLIPILMSSVSSGIFKTLFFIKDSITLLNTLIFFISTYWLSRFFSRTGMVASLLLMLTSDIVLFYASNIRVDLLGYWFCLFSLLYLLESRYTLAGLLLGLGFITTQKVIWYILASNGALFFYWLLKPNLKIIFSTIKLNGATLIVLFIYILFWSLFSDFHTVIHNIFYDASAMYQLDWYNDARKVFWSYSISLNPLLFGLWPLTILSLFVSYKEDNTYQQRLLIIPYAFIILGCLIFYKQIFPYYMQVLIPVAFVLYASFFTWMFDLFLKNPSLEIAWIGKKGVWLLMYGYGVFIFFIRDLLMLPWSYLFLLLLPFVFGLYITQSLSPKDRQISFKIVGVTIFFMIIYQTTLYVDKVKYMNGNYQKANVTLMNQLLQDGSHYVAGIEFIYDKTQAIAGMKHLMGPAIQFLYTPTDKLRQAMLPSLDADPKASVESILKDFKHSRVKFYVNNYRMMAIPPAIKTFLNTEYEHFWGSIYLYAPLIPPGTRRVRLKFSGNYLIESLAANAISLNGKNYPSFSIHYFKKGDYQSQSDFAYRLKLLLETDIKPNSAFQQDDWGKLVS